MTAVLALLLGLGAVAWAAWPLLRSDARVPLGHEVPTDRAADLIESTTAVIRAWARAAGEWNSRPTNED